MDGVELLLHVVCGKQVDNAGELQQKVILETEYRCRTDNGCLRENAADDLLTTSLGSKKKNKLKSVCVLPTSVVPNQLATRSSGEPHLGPEEFRRRIKVGVV